jgi:DNA-binding CsgD family transcriptional regulator
MNYPFADYCQDIKSLSSPLKTIGIDYVSFTRVYKTGQRIFFSTEPKIIEFFSEDVHLKRAPRAPNEMRPDNYNSNQIIIWSTLPDQSFFSNIKHLHIGDHGMHLFDEKKDDYCDSFGFATSRYNESIINSYLSNLGLLRNFMNYFHENSSSMINQAKKENVFLPFNEQKPIITLRSEELEEKFSDKKIKYKFSRRQLECISLLVKGFTAKEIADQLHLSFRTVESYIELMKKKLNCKNKTELVIRLMSIKK